MSKLALADVPNCFNGCRGLRCTMQGRVLLESTCLLLGNEYQDPGERVAYLPPGSEGPRTGRCRSKPIDTSAAAPKAHALDTCPDALRRRGAVNAQQTTAS